MVWWADSFNNTTDSLFYAAQLRYIVALKLRLRNNTFVTWSGKRHGFWVSHYFFRQRLSWPKQLSTVFLCVLLPCFFDYDSSNKFRKLYVKLEVLEKFYYLKISRHICLVKDISSVIGPGWYHYVCLWNMKTLANWIEQKCQIASPKYVFCRFWSTIPTNEKNKECK